MSVMAATTSPPYIHRSYPLPSSTGDASYSPVMLDRFRRPDSYSRHLPPLSHVRGSEYNTSHGHSRSYVYQKAGAPVFPESSSESPSPRETRPSLPLPQQFTTTPVQSMSISFATTISATSTWAMSPCPYSPSSTSSSSPVSRGRVQPREQHRAIESEQGGAISRREHDTFEAAQRKPHPIPSRPASHGIQLRASISPDQPRPRATSPVGRLHAASFTAERHTYRERQDSWSPEGARRPLPPTLWNPQPSRGTSPEFVQGSSRANRRWAPPPPPSPSPSTSSYSTNEASGRTDTDPTDEEEPVKIEQESVKLPSFRTAFPSAPHWHSPYSWDGATRTYESESSTSPVRHYNHHHHRDALSPLSRSPATSPSSVEHGAGWSPRSPFRHECNNGDLPVQVPDIRYSVSDTRNEPPAVAAPNARAQWKVQQGPQSPAPTRGRPAPLENVPPVGRAQKGDLPVMSPTPKKYRFVTSKPSEAEADAELREEGLDGRGRPVTVSPSGTKRRYPGASPESSIDVPLTPETPEDEEENGPRKRRQGEGQGQGQLPYEGSFPVVAGESTCAPGGRFVRSPRGAIVPAYHYDTERALKCAFAGCGAVLTGKKSETASHMRSHFLQAVGETLECPWPVEGEDGRRARCGMAFKDSANFGRHVSSKHIKAEEYQCNRCGRPFARRDAALRHMKTLCRTDGAGPRRKNEKKIKARTEEYEEVHMFDD